LPEFSRESKIFSTLKANTMSERKNEASRLDLHKSGQLEERRSSRRPAVAVPVVEKKIETAEENTQLSATSIALTLSVVLLLIIAFFAM
jgi:hypothetical protein